MGVTQTLGEVSSFASRALIKHADFKTQQLFTRSDWALIMIYEKTILSSLKSCKNVLLY